MAVQGHILSNFPWNRAAEGLSLSHSTTLQRWRWFNDFNVIFFYLNWFSSFRGATLSGFDIHLTNKIIVLKISRGLTSKIDFNMSFANKLNETSFVVFVPLVSINRRFFSHFQFDKNIFASLCAVILNLYKLYQIWPSWKTRA